MVGFDCRLSLSYISLHDPILLLFQCPHQIMNINTQQKHPAVRFPYGNLADAEKVAYGIHQLGGLECTTISLQKKLGLSDRQSTFRQWLATAGIFGLVQTRRGHVRLRKIGQRIIDPDWVWRSVSGHNTQYLHIQDHQR